VVSCQCNIGADATPRSPALLLEEGARRDPHAGLFAQGRERGLKEPKTLYVHIGGRIRERRLSLALSGPQLGERAGMSAQQVYKYEAASDRISASLLHGVAWALQVPITFFFESANAGPSVASARDRLLLEFMSNVTEISDEKHLEVISEIVRMLAGSGGRPRRSRLRSHRGLHQRRR